MGSYGFKRPKIASRNYHNQKFYPIQFHSRNVGDISRFIWHTCVFSPFSHYFSLSSLLNAVMSVNDFYFCTIN